MTKIWFVKYIKEKLMEYPKPFVLVKYRYNMSNILVPSHMIIKTIDIEFFNNACCDHPYITEVTKTDLRDVEASTIIKFMGKTSGVPISLEE